MSEEEVPLLKRENVPHREWTWSDKINDFVDNNKYFVGFIMVCIVISCAGFVFESEPSIAKKYAHEFIYVELSITAIFLFEFTARFFTTRETNGQFFSSFMTWVDILAVFPTVMTVCAALANKNIEVMEMFETGDNVDLRFIRLFRLVRLLKIGRHAFEFQVVGVAIRESAGAIFILFLMLGVTTIFYASIIMVVERGTWDDKLDCFIRYDGNCSPFQSIMMSAWWVIVTTTTVGYGDAFPITPGGKVVAAFCMISGILILALLTTVIGIQFTANYYVAADDLRLEAARREYGFNVGKVFWPLLRQRQSEEFIALKSSERKAIEQTKGYAVLSDDIDQIKADFEESMNDIQTLVTKALEKVQVVQKERGMAVNYHGEIVDTMKVTAALENLVRTRLHEL